MPDEYLPATKAVKFFFSSSSNKTCQQIQFEVWIKCPTPTEAILEHLVMQTNTLKAALKVCTPHVSSLNIHKTFAFYERCELHG